MENNIKYLLFGILLHSVYSYETFSLKNGFWLGEPSKNISTTTADSPKEYYFEQNLDHFNYKETTTWKQRYFVNEKYYKPGGPVFIMISGEQSSNWINEGAWIEYAKKFNALCFLLEARYYGKSRPVPDLSTKNLFLLLVESDLGDVTAFRSGMMKKYNLEPDSKWIAFGGYYSGTLAAWLRGKFPHLIHGAVTSSAPIAAIEDFHEYYDMVGKALAANSYGCLDAIEKAMIQIELLLDDVSDAKSLNGKFKLCHPIENSLQNRQDLINLFENLASNIAYIVEFNKINSPHSIFSIDDICTIMTDKSINKEIDRLSALYEKILESKKFPCFNYKYDKMIYDLKETFWNAEEVEAGERQWLKKTCHELGFFETSTKENGKFGHRFPLSFFSQKCNDVFGPIFNLTTGVARTNLFYGGLDAKSTNVLYVVNGLDPWKPITQPTNEKSMLLIEGTSHCADFYQPSDHDVIELVNGRKKIELFIENLLN